MGIVYLMNILKSNNMKTELKKVSKYKSKFDNEFWELWIDGKLIGTYEKSEYRHHVGIVDNQIHH